MSIQDAMFASSFPCNPRPFANALTEFDPSSIQSDEAKRILWVLMAQAYGQLATIDLTREYMRLSETRQPANAG